MPQAPLWCKKCASLYHFPADYVQFLPNIPADYVQNSAIIPADYVGKDCLNF